VSAFGFSGTNAHVLLEEYQPPADVAAEWCEPQLILLSAKNRQRLDAATQRLLAFLQHPPASDNRLQPALGEQLAALLSLRPEDIDPTEHWEVLGLDVLAQATFCERINERYGLSVTVETLRDYPTLATLAAQLGSGLDYSKETKTLPPLADIAYTLQVGRMPMEERLALVVSDHDELLTKLQQLCAGNDDAAQVVRGNVKKASTDRLLVAGKAGAAFLQVAMQERELDRLAALWVAGVEIDWSLLTQHSPRRPRRVSLPTYPFATGRYWLPETTPQPRLGQTPAPAANVARLHPLIERNSSTLFTQSYSSVLHGHEYFLTDHIINGQAIVPGAVLLEMARAAGELAGMAQVTQISEVTWLQPVIVADQPVELSVTLAAEQAELVNFQLVSNDTVFARGHLHSATL
jgi:acyl transferase domain-containing protein